jgi:hypothetical protein
MRTGLLPRLLELAESIHVNLLSTRKYFLQLFGGNCMYEKSKRRELAIRFLFLQAPAHPPF